MKGYLIGSIGYISILYQPNSLKLVLTALSMQDYTDFEVLIADDGSHADYDIETFVNEFAETVSFPVRFITHPDMGFRKATISNKAIALSKGQKLVFLDGDCVPFNNHVGMHINSLKLGCFCVGGGIMLSLQDSLTLTRDDVLAGKHAEFLTAAALKPLIKKYRTSWLQSALGMRRGPRIMGCNFSVMRTDIIKINGYDENYNGHSKMDSDLRNRLRNNGLKGINMLKSNIVCHLNHGLDKKSQTSVNKRNPEKSYYYQRCNTIMAAKGIKEIEWDSQL